MIATLFSLFAAGTLASSDISTPIPHSIPINSPPTIEASAIPQKNNDNLEPVIEATAAIAVDLENGLILYEKNIYEPLHIASLTKLMTAIIILEESNLNEAITISRQASQAEGSKIWLALGESITTENLLYAALIRSANDAAVALAEHNSGTIEDFVAKMNKKSTALGLTATTFSNPTGLDEATDTSQNISTAYDLTLLSRYAYNKAFIRRAASIKELTIASTNEQFQHTFENTNQLLNSYLTVLGLKTGTTELAGQCLIAVIQNDNGNNILTVVLDSPNRYQETKTLADWVFRTYTW